MDKIIIDINAFTWGELAEIEQLAGTEAFDALLEGKTRASVVPVLIWIAKRKGDPSFTLEDARNLPVTTEIEVTAPNLPGGDALA